LALLLWESVRSRCAAGCAVFLLALVLCPSRDARAANDPKLAWRSFETAHFRVTYYSTEDEVAERIGDLAEDIYKRLVPAIGWPPSERTEILLTDQTDSANGSATALPFDAVRLNVTAPDDMSPLGDIDDWYLELVTHEYTHILHTDHIQGIPALLNRILGKTFAPNQAQPHWLLEGLAVFEESARTSGGRLRSSMWNMWMRADILEGKAAYLDVFSNTPRRWPQGNIWYLYGSFFMQWIADTYGERAIRAMIDDYAYQVVPYAINRSIRRATGRTYEELYPSWIDSLRRSFGAEADAIRLRGLREGLRVTHTGNTYEHPRWIPERAWADHAGDLSFYVDDGHTSAGVWALPLVRDSAGNIVGSREDRRDNLIRMNGVGGTSFMRDGTVLFSTGDVHADLFTFDDLFELPARTKEPTGLEGRRVRWTDGWRAIDPSVSPDDRRVAFVTNHRGTQYLMLGDVVPAPDRPGAHAIANVRPLVPSRRWDQAYTPRWSPDGRHLAYSSWTRGGYRDIRIVDTTDGSFVEVTHDRAIDGDPVYSPDGRYLYFHSDRTGVTNVYAYELATGRLRQVTNVINGAYQPEPSPDGKWLAYVGYTHEGYDMFVMPLDESRWLDAVPYDDARPPPPPEPPHVVLSSHPYDPIPTLVPRSYSVMIQPGHFGQESVIGVTGTDIASQHGITATLTTEFEHPDLQFDVRYVYARLPFDVSFEVVRSVQPETSFKLGDNTVPWVSQTTGVGVGLSKSLPRAFDSQSVNISYGFTNVQGELPFNSAPLDPYDTPNIPRRGWLSDIHLGWGYSNAQGYLYSVSNERGFDIGASFDWADPIIGSDFGGFAARGDFSTYLANPWIPHQVLALHAGGGMGGGDRAGKGVYYVGGFQDLNLVSTIENTLIQGGVQLRGYPLFAQTGNYYAIGNAEYRFPIWNVDHGISTLPLFLSRISGNVFVDSGSAFDTLESAQFLTGLGGELWLDCQLGYVLDFTFRAGLARGINDGGITKSYFVAAVPF
jgi:hypothetical protein